MNTEINILGIPIANTTAPDAAIRPVELACRVCGKPIAYPGNDGNSAQVIAAWNLMAGKPPLFTCRECLDEKKRRERQDAFERAEEIRQVDLRAIRADLPGTLARCGVPAHWIDASFDSCPDLPPKLLGAARKWAEEPYGIIYLHGTPGAGKSYLAVAMLAHALANEITKPDACRYVSEHNFLDELKATYDPQAAPVSVRALPSNHPARIGLLLYDDMGAARQTDWTRGEIAGLLEKRHAANLPTIITANIDPDALASAIDGRTASRVAEYRMIIEFPKVDLRVKGTIRPRPFSD